MIGINNGARHISVPSSVAFDSNYMCPQSQDCNVVQCKYGKQLIHLCIATGLKIANGRVLGDPCGTYTCHYYNGSSRVHYTVHSFTQRFTKS